MGAAASIKVHNGNRAGTNEAVVASLLGSTTSGRGGGIVPDADAVFEHFNKHLTGNNDDMYQHHLSALAKSRESASKSRQQSASQGSSDGERNSCSVLPLLDRQDVILGRASGGSGGVAASQAVVPRTSLEQKVLAFLNPNIIVGDNNGDDGRHSGTVALLLAPSGAGKSTFVASLTRKLTVAALSKGNTSASGETKHDGTGTGASANGEPKRDAATFDLVVTVFVGAVQGSANPGRVLTELTTRLREFMLRSGVEPASEEKGGAAEAETTSGDVAALSGLLAAQLKDLSQASKRVLLAFDAVNELDRGGGAHNMTWLPTSIPAGISVLLSAIREDSVAASGSGGNVGVGEIDDVHRLSHVVRSVVRRWQIPTANHKATATTQQTAFDEGKQEEPNSSSSRGGKSRALFYLPRLSADEKEQLLVARGVDATIVKRVTELEV